MSSRGKGEIELAHFKILIPCWFPWKASKRKLLGFLTLEARKKAKMQVECSQKRELKTSSKGRWE